MTRHRQRLSSWLRGEAELAPVTRLLGIAPAEVGDGFVRLSMPAGPVHHNAFGSVHGGLLVAFADVAMGCALATLLEDDEVFTTLEQHMDHLRPVRDSRLSAAARVVRRGRGAGHVECEIADAEGRPLARASCACLITRVAAGATPS